MYIICRINCHSALQCSLHPWILERMGELIAADEAHGVLLGLDQIRRLFRREKPVIELMLRLMVRPPDRQPQLGVIASLLVRRRRLADTWVAAAIERIRQA